jgi:hypothetical protein
MHLLALCLGVLFSLQVVAASPVISIIEVHVSHDHAIPEVVILGEHLCARPHHETLGVLLGTVRLTNVNCSLLGSLSQPLDVVTADITHNPPAGDYLLELEWSNGKSKKSKKFKNAVEFMLTLGSVGPQGEQGVTGETGPQGEQGMIGETGTQGEQGTTGETGIQGEQGTTGEAGIQGEQGTTGETGIQGEQGTTGETGTQGAQGISGQDGTDGSPGEAGQSGPPGTDGVEGPAGTDGASAIIALAGLSCPENNYLAGFQFTGELLCRPLPSGLPSTPSGIDPDFVGSCFNFSNDSSVNLNDNDWLDDCIKPGATSLRILVKDSGGVVVYDQSASIAADWTTSAITSTAGIASQHSTAAHDRSLTMGNMDNMLIMSKSAKSTTGCFSSFANGYGIVIYTPQGSGIQGMRLMLMGYEHGVSGGRRSLSGWSESNELSYSSAGSLGSCSSQTMSDAALNGSAAIFVQ